MYKNNEILKPDSEGLVFLGMLNKLGTSISTFALVLSKSRKMILYDLYPGKDRSLKIKNE